MCTVAVLVSLGWPWSTASTSKVNSSSFSRSRFTTLRILPRIDRLKDIYSRFIKPYRDPVHKLDLGKVLWNARYIKNHNAIYLKLQQYESSTFLIQNLCKTFAKLCKKENRDWRIGVIGVHTYIYMGRFNIFCKEKSVKKERVGDKLQASLILLSPRIRKRLYVKYLYKLSLNKTMYNSIKNEFWLLGRSKKLNPENTTTK